MVIFNDSKVSSKLVAIHFSTETKRKLVQLLQADIYSEEKTTTVNSSMQAVAFSLAKSYQTGKLVLRLPELSETFPTNEKDTGSQPEERS